MKILLIYAQAWLLLGKERLNHNWRERLYYASMFCVITAVTLVYMGGCKLKEKQLLGPTCVFILGLILTCAR